MINRKSKSKHRQLEIECDIFATQIVLHLDNGRCALCSSTWRMSPHHIIKRDNKRVRHNPNNLILLCEDCHNKAEASDEWFLIQLKEKYPHMHSWHLTNDYHEVMQFYHQHLEKVYAALRTVHMRMIMEPDETRKRFRRI